MSNPPTKAFTNMIKNRLIYLIIICTLPIKVYSDDWQSWKQEFYQRASTADISRPLLNEFIENVNLYEPAIQSDQNQAEFQKFIWEYLKTAVSDDRIQNGKKNQLNYQEKLLNTTILTGVPLNYLIAIWGMETNYGNYLGNVLIKDSMATLAYEGRRKNFFELQLIALLQLIDRGDVPSLSVKGSWAGGMGHTQFIPTTYLKYETDGNGDGHSDPWDVVDALSSSANFLQKKGWKQGYTWGREVFLPESFNYLLANNDRYLALSKWQQLGVLKINRKPLTNAEITAKLFVPAGKNGPKFLLYKNFDVIKKYNNSNAYALAVCLLADQIANEPAIQTPWPKNAKPLNSEIIQEVQTILTNKGFNAGPIDGILGQGTKRALQHYQQSISEIPDGFLTNALYQKLIKP